MMQSVSSLSRSAGTAGLAEADASSTLARMRGVEKQFRRGAEAVQVAETVGDTAKLTAGLAARDRVVVEGPATLKDGDRVRVAAADEEKGSKP